MSETDLEALRWSASAFYGGFTLRLLPLDKFLNRVSFFRWNWHGMAISPHFDSQYLSVVFTPKTVSIISWFILAMCIFPDVQKKGQQALDSVLGGLKTPGFVDRPDLPYIEAMCKEVLRWNCVLPGGGPFSRFFVFVVQEKSSPHPCNQC